MANRRMFLIASLAISIGITSAQDSQKTNGAKKPLSVELSGPGYDRGVQRGEALKLDIAEPVGRWLFHLAVRTNDQPEE